MSTNIFKHIFPFNHRSVFQFLTSEAGRRRIWFSLEYALENLNETDPMRQFIVWFYQDKGYDFIIDIFNIDVEELRVKMATLGYPTTQKELEERIPRFVLSEMEPEEIEEIRDMMSKNNTTFLIY